MSDHFGCCPVCGHEGEYMNIERVHWNHCPEHGLKWRIGENLFSSWKHETEEDWKKNDEYLSPMPEVEPLFPVGYCIGGEWVCQYCVTHDEETETPRTHKMDSALYRLIKERVLCERCGQSLFKGPDIENPANTSADSKDIPF